MSSAFNIPASPVVTEAMVEAYLKANDAYWRETDKVPTWPGKWRTGTPSEATRVSLKAALAAAPTPPVDAVPGEPVALDGCELCNGRRGGVPGNENIIDGKRVCDYCHSDSVAVAQDIPEWAVAEALRRLGCDMAPVAWVLHFNDPDPQIDIEFCRECPPAWAGKAEPLYEGPGIRPFDARMAIARLAWLHSSESNDVDGYEWGIYRVKWENGRAAEVWQTAADFSDLDAARQVAPIAPAAAAEPSEPVKRCSNCDDSGQVSSITGEWHGRCHCEAGRSASPLFAPDRERAASLVASEGMVLVPRELLQAASKSLGSFVSEEGWVQQDMDVMDSIDAALAARASAGEAQS